MPSADVQLLDPLQVLLGRLDDVERHLDACARLLCRTHRCESLSVAAAAAIHDINNILTSIGGYARAARERPADESLTAAALARCITATERGSAIARSLLDLLADAPPESGGHALVSEAVHEAITLAESGARGLNVEYLTSADRPLRARLDATSLVRALHNLLVNAAAAAAGACRVTVRAEWTQGGHSDTCDDGGWVRISVSDDGPGIPDTVRGRLFRPFARGAEVVGGHGLGLWICRSLVEAAGGCIGFESVAGEGTTFTILLPAAM